MDYKKALQEMKENTPKTAIEWYEREMFKTGFIQHLDIFNEIYKQAKQMEKDQILRSFSVGNDCGYCFAKTKDTQQYNTGEQYYNETYNK